jgi:phenylacetate-coenzyme A ligase PaaK-like adenylate-forming protein
MTLPTTTTTATTTATPTAVDPLVGARALAAADRISRADRDRLQRQRLTDLVEHARAHSPYYRERLGPPDGDVDLATLPTLDKVTLMARFDDVVCDPRLRLDDLRRHLDGPGAASPYLGTYRVASTSGSSGSPGLFVFDESGWASYVAQFLRVVTFTDRPPWEQLGVRVGVVTAVDPRHVSSQVAMTCAALGLMQPRPLPVTLPMDAIVAGLNEYRPDILHAYGSYAPLLADEQLAGRLRIAPHTVTSSSELLTPDMAARVEAAFGVAPFDMYATTEGLWAGQCAQHAGFHLFEEEAIVENVDADGRPVPDGERGARVLLTNLANRVQPLIRYEIPDVVTIDPEPCPCGRTLRRIGSVDGRSDDVLRLDGVQVHPLQFAVLATDPDVREFQVRQHGRRLELRIVPAQGVAVAGIAGRLSGRVAAALRELGVADPQVTVEGCAGLPRSAGGKLRLVVADVSPGPGPGDRSR